jgi:two-component sensor histidine kinase/putative methionine-R-sulfoxide reductase with GAF domain
MLTDIRDVEKILRQQSLLAAFGGYAYHEQDVIKTMTEAARVCAESLEVPFCKISRYRPLTNDLLVEAGVGWDQAIVGQIVSKVDHKSPQGRAFVTGEPVIFEDLSKEPGLVLPPFYAEFGIISTIDVVIKGNGVAYGVLEVDSPQQHTYDVHDVDFLTGFTNVLAEAIAASRRTGTLLATIKQMKSLVEEKEQLLAEKDQLLSDKKNLAQELQHRVRNNLQLVLAMLERQIIDIESGPVKQGVESIARRVMTLAQVYDHLLGSDMSRSIDSGLYLKALCGSLKDFQVGQFPDVDMGCHVDEVILSLDTVTALGIVVAELVANAYLHAFPQGKGMIDVALRQSQQSGHATLTVADDGVGFVTASESKRHGLGLVRRLAQQIRGTAQVISCPGSTTWTMEFPITAPDAI